MRGHVIHVYSVYSQAMKVAKVGWSLICEAGH